MRAIWNSVPFAQPLRAILRARRCSPFREKRERERITHVNPPWLYLRPEAAHLFSSLLFSTLESFSFLYRAHLVFGLSTGGRRY
ncbi:hypothetical protein DTO045G8_6364 [Paecilomyces variotii]|nr:hypothetical protein DTO045G8_6364 [Paecilomyces variotii]